MTDHKQPGDPDFEQLATRIHRLCLALLGDADHARDAERRDLMTMTDRLQ